MAVPTSITDLSVTAASNSPAGTDTVASTTGPDDYLRALAAIIKEACATVYTAIGADTITFSTTPTFSAYAAGMRFHFIAAGANTGAVTLNINSLGAKAVTREGTTALAAGDIASGAVVCVEYDGTRFQITSGRSVQPLDALLTALAAQTTAANQLQGYSGSDVAALFNIGAATGYIPLWDHIPLNSRVTKTAAYPVGVGDRGKLIDCTTGTWALTMNPSTLGANFAFAVRNSGTGIITLTPSTGTVDGAATVELGAGASCLVFCDGTNFETVSKNGPSVQSLSTGGYMQLPGGLIVQWKYGTAAAQGTSQTITLPITFPTAVLHVGVSPTQASVSGNNTGIQLRAQSWTTSSVTVDLVNTLVSANSNTVIPSVIAIGY